MELLVIEGRDAGQQFTLDGDEILIGRRLDDSQRQRGVVLHDPTVSGHQAVVRRQNGGLVIDQLPGTTNPTLIDGRPADGVELEPGSRITMGRTLMEVRSHDGLALSHLTQAFAVPDLQAGPAPSTETMSLQVPSLPDEDEDAATTEFRAIPTPIGELVVEGGSQFVNEQSFPIWSTQTQIGRGKACQVRVSDMGISRNHAELVWDGGQLVLHHRSATNPTLLNGCEVLDREVVRDGDAIQLADRLMLRVSLSPATPRSRDASTSGESPSPLDGGGAPAGSERVGQSTDRIEVRSLRQEMEEKVLRDRAIEEQFSVEGSFLDVDVVNSYGMKSQSGRAEHIIVSFERFRTYVGGVVTEHRGHVLNSNGDELMCYFESTLDAVRAGSQVLSRLDDFNRRNNLLPVPFSFRVGVHTGRSLVDLQKGIAYSAVLDIAGHLQKQAEHNGMVISEQTLKVLPEELPFEYAGALDREGLAFYKLVGEID
jgi:pSer/pThr/pTyr-binding forkhead associated (FHA) protein/class 3 adenylate cyclase